MLEIVAHRQPMLHSIAKLLDALHRNDIVYCNLKGNDQHLKNALMGESDVDILFDVKQRVKLESILHVLGFKEFVAIRPRRFKDIVDFFILDPESGKVVHLHTYYAFTIGEPFLKGYQPDIAGHILNSRIYNEAYQLYCIQPALELIFLYLTETLKLRHRDLIRLYVKENLSPKAKVTYESNWLRARTSPAEVRDVINSVFRGDEVMVKLVQSEFDQKRLHKLAPDVKKALAKYRLYSPLEGLWLRWQREATLKIRRKLAFILDLPILSMRTNPRGGVIVGIVESNDVLKAILLKSIKDTFSKKIDVYHVSFRAEKKEGGPGSAPRQEYSFARSMRAIFQTLAAFKKIKHIQSAKKKGALVICDCCPIYYPHFNNKNGCLPANVRNSKNAILRYLASVESKLYAHIDIVDLPDLLFEFTAVGDPVITQGPEGNVYRNIDIETERSGNSPVGDKIRHVQVDGGKPVAEKLAVLRQEIWKHL